MRYNVGDRVKATITPHLGEDVRLLGREITIQPGDEGTVRFYFSKDRRAYAVNFDRLGHSASIIVCYPNEIAKA
jgi:hypothetical protein